MGNLIKGEENEELIQFLRENENTFAWSHEDMVDIDPTKSVHCLNPRITIKQVKQKQRRFTPERNQIIVAEVDRLFKIGMIREVKYPD